MTLELPESTRDIVEGLRKFIRAEVVPRQDDNQNLFGNPRLLYDETGRYSQAVLALRKEVRLASAMAGYYTALVPEALGGGGEGAVTLYALWEDIHHTFGPKYWLAHDTVAHWVSGPSGNLSHWSEPLQKEALSAVMSGEKTLCFGMSEPDAGSDIWRMQTRAIRTEHGWRINGTKQWTSNGPYADYALIFAVTDLELLQSRRGGISAFLVPTTAPGFTVDSVIRMWGHSGGNEAIIGLVDVDVLEYQLVGELDAGLEVGLFGISEGRLYNAGKGVGLARWALEQALEYSKMRTTFGKHLFDHQSISFTLAEAAMEVLPAHLLGLHAAAMIDDGKPALMETAMAKAFTVEMSARTIERSIQVIGGMGFTNEMYLTQAWQEERIVHVADGSAQMQRRMIAGRLGSGDVSRL